ncbi:unnamed protein product [Mycena citricolor]|uniref:CBM21 domain-containing protein n=1 Tax=Mycena citricolor TaxID=2018698 RepID=A0AAD2HNJ8_9AGAR|nr:unnamed protein product [Mycena citricolor]
MIVLSRSPSMDFRHTNAAGAPLPILPRRLSSVNRVLSSSSSTSSFSSPSSSSSTPPKSSSTIKLVVQQATPPDPESSTSSSSSEETLSKIKLRPRRIRGVRPPEFSTPTPLAVEFPHRRSPSPPDEDATPRPKFAGGLGPRVLSTPHLSLLASPSTPVLSDETPRILRKKSGQPVKSSLKSSTPKQRASLNVVIGNSTGSKSEPTTPTRSVHFDTKQHVKLFLAEQKPLAVSRDGSPTDDTSGAEDFPEWIFGNGRRDEGRLDMLVTVPEAKWEMDVKLQTLKLADDGANVTGTIAVRNLAFDKWVAVRFTLDGWQTTSEVTARHLQSLAGGQVDIFSFSIRLNDVLARIEGKEMLLAVRYNSAGREMWDNNEGSNYRAVFRRVRESERPKPADAPVSVSSENDSSGSGTTVAADLRSRLERVVKTQGQPPSQLSTTTENFKAGGSLAARYDFNNSAKQPWHPHSRTQSYPAGFDSPSPTNSAHWPPRMPPKASLGSPRDASDDVAFRPVHLASTDNEEPVLGISPAPLPVGRYHQRGYFDVPLRQASEARLTSPGTSWLGSYIPDGSEENTPSYVTSSGSSASGTASPASPTDGVGLPAGVSPAASYHNFLDRFCFYTGPEEIEGLPSRESVEEYISPGISSESRSATPIAA